MTRIATTASLVGTLVEYDGPQLLALRSDRGFQMLAVAVRRSGSAKPFFGCEFRDSVSSRYFNEKIDLYFAFNRLSDTHIISSILSLLTEARYH